MGTRTNVQKKFETLIASLDDMLDTRVAAQDTQPGNTAEVNYYSANEFIPCLPTSIMSTLVRSYQKS